MDIIWVFIKMRGKKKIKRDDDVVCADFARETKLNLLWL